MEERPAILSTLIAAANELNDIHELRVASSPRNHLNHQKETGTGRTGPIGKNVRSSLDYFT